MPPKKADAQVVSKDLLPPAPAFWKEIEDAAREYAYWRDERIAAGQQEQKFAAQLDGFRDAYGINASEIEYNGVRLEFRKTIKIKVTVEESSSDATSDPDEPAIDGTVHDDEEDDSPLARDLKDIHDRNDARLSEDEAA